MKTYMFIFKVLSCCAVMVMMGVAPGYCAVYSYDELNRLKMVTYDNGNQVVYNYDGAGNLLNTILMPQASPAVLAVPPTPPAEPTQPSPPVLGAGENSAVVAPSDHIPPALSLSTLASGTVTNYSTLNVTGTVSDGVTTVTVNNEAVTLRGLDFSCPVALQTGDNVITIRATDGIGSVTAETRTITLRPALHTFSVISPGDNSMVTTPFVTVTGTVDNSATVVATVNDGSPHTATIAGNGYAVSLNLSSGLNTITITVTDGAGTVVSAKRSVQYVPSALLLDIVTPVQDTQTDQQSYTVRGRVDKNITGTSVAVLFEGVSHVVTVTDEGAFTYTVPFTTEKVYPVMVTATDAGGHSATVVRSIIYGHPYKGDLSGDGLIGIGDVLMMYQHVQGHGTLTETQLSRADVAPLGPDGQPLGDGKLDIADVIILLRKSVGLGW